MNKNIRITMSVSVEQAAKALQRLARYMTMAVQPGSAYRNGYIVVNHRGRNKLVDMRRIRRGKA